MNLSLRPGDYVYLKNSSNTSYPKVSLARISGVDKDFVWLVHYTSSLHEEPVKVCRNDAESISIDTGWLDDFGFQKENAFCYFIPGIACDLLVQITHTEVLFGIHDEVNNDFIQICKVSTVSHFQNLVYDITGSMPALINL